MLIVSIGQARAVNPSNALATVPSGAVLLGRNVQQVPLNTLHPFLPKPIYSPKPSQKLHAVVRKAHSQHPRCDLGIFVGCGRDN